MSEGVREWKERRDKDRERKERKRRMLVDGSETAKQWERLKNNKAIKGKETKASQGTI